VNDDESKFTVVRPCPSRAGQLNSRSWPSRAAPMPA
jgi:hypothetical protein